VNENSTPEIPHMQLSSEKARQRLDWKPLLGFSQGLERTVRWYRDYFAYPSDIVGALPQEALLERATMRSVTEAGIGRQAGTGR